jgi:hypothetical protein
MSTDRRKREDGSRRTQNEGEHIVRDKSWNEGVMSDDEWQSWAETYAREARPAPPIVGRALTDRRRAIIGIALVYVMGAALIAAGIENIRQARTTVALASPLFTIAFVLILMACVHAVMRGAFGMTGGTPLQLLEDMERRHAARRRLARLLPGLTGLGAAGAIGADAATMIAARRFDLPSALETLAACAVTVGFVWLTVKRIGRLIDRELREAAEARRLLTEDAL